MSRWSLHRCPRQQLEQPGTHRLPPRLPVLWLAVRTLRRTRCFPLPPHRTSRNLPSENSFSSFRFVSFLSFPQIPPLAQMPFLRVSAGNYRFVTFPSKCVFLTLPSLASCSKSIAYFTRQPVSLVTHASPTIS